MARPVTAAVLLPGVLPGDWPRDGLALSSEGAHAFNAMLGLLMRGQFPRVAFIVVPGGRGPDWWGLWANRLAREPDDEETRAAGALCWMMFHQFPAWWSAPVSAGRGQL